MEVPGAKAASTQAQSVFTPAQVSHVRFAVTFSKPLVHADFKTFLYQN